MWPRHGARRVDALAAVDRRVGNRRQRAGVFHNTAEEVLALFGQPRFAGRARAFTGEDVRFGLRAGRIPDRGVGVTAIARQPFDRFRHESGAQPAFLRDRFGHVLEKAALVGSAQQIVELPVPAYGRRSRAINPPFLTLRSASCQFCADDSAGWVCHGTVAAAVRCRHRSLASDVGLRGGPHTRLSGAGPRPPAASKSHGTSD